METDKICAERLQKIEDKIHYYKVTIYGERVKEEIMTIIEFETRWKASAPAVLHILNNQSTLNF